MSDELTPEIAKQAVLQLRSASQFQVSDSHVYVGVEGYGVLYLHNNEPVSLDCGNNRGAMWKDIPAEHQTKILELLANPPSRGTAIITSVDTDEQTIYFNSEPNSP